MRAAQVSEHKHSTATHCLTAAALISSEIFLSSWQRRSWGGGGGEIATQLLNLALNKLSGGAVDDAVFLSKKHLK